ncbi:hypothetical protein ACERIT_09365 [Halopenitus sp. H-Gu1]|uniref:DUF7475 family protein n=1 Tax=Halopenitus sp. H-Gu1 TaxID=3242697 RepID=UPI00359DCB23
MGQTAGGYVETESLTTTHWLAILLVLATGIIHVYAGLVEGRIPVSLAGVGFLGAIALFLLDFRRSLLYPVGIVYTAVQLPLWYVGKAGEYTMIGYVDKTIQVVLIIVLVYLFWKERKTPERSRGTPAA